MSARDQCSLPFVNVNTVSGVSAGRRFAQLRHSQSNVVTQIATGKSYATPLVIGETNVTLKGVGVYIPVGGNVSSIAIRIGIYAKTDASNLWPGALLLDCGSIYVGSSGPQVNSISFVASANDLLWIVFVTSHASPGGSVPTTRSGTSVGPIFGVDSNFTNAFCSLSTTGSLALPSTYPSSGVLGDGNGNECGQAIVEY